MKSEKEPRRWIFLRGLARESGHWGAFVERFQSRFPRAQIEALDSPGSGRRWQEESPAEISAIVDSLRRARVTQEPASILAISLGGMLAVDWAARFPQEVKSLVLLNTSFGNLSPFYHRMTLYGLGQLLRASMESDLYNREARILDLVVNSPHVRESAIAHWARLAQQHPVSWQTLLRQLWAASRFHFPDLSSLKSPCLVLTSKRDRLVHFQCSHDLHRHWVGSILREHENAGHDLPLDAPDWVLDQIDETSH